MIGERATGVLLHISSLPSAFGAGDFGKNAFKFAKFLRKYRIKYWQILPLNPTDAAIGNSPYSSDSAFALNPLFLDPEGLYSEGLIEQKDLMQIPGKPSKVNYEAAYACKKNLLYKAFLNFESDKYSDFHQFIKENLYWIEDYALFRSLKFYFKGKSWDNWPAGIRDRNQGELNRYRSLLEEGIRQEKFTQFILWKQWKELRKYCNEMQLMIFGDLPIYVQHDSADVWAHPENFKLGRDKKPTHVAGVPPDYFSEDGQLWGNPVFNWKHMQMDGFRWWVERLKQNFRYFDLLRIDHFRAFLSYWEIEAGEDTARNGEWVDASAQDFYRHIRKAFPKLPLVAENLGIITPEVNEFLEEHGIPGMQVLQFGFQSMDSVNEYLPHNFEKNCVAYTGTHDNNTSRGWFRQELDDQQRKWLQKYFDQEITEENIARRMICLLLQSTAKLVIFPLQDLLSQDETYRMNKPGTAGNNWMYRFSWNDIDEDKLLWLQEMNELYGR
ncbi:MAG: 4-alpha-glucanotransferase [Bacteroidales bacterium]|nr:4-alpha-glucanotransferase [Bacteroidales bacterium]MCF8386637.1 4-alpha-glucanotransferase [Bacteroidales bacterium]MCF8398927.1 4-alpha-glucanotransferase [Bacteroidales bacterium]